MSSCLSSVYPVVLFPKQCGVMVGFPTENFRKNLLPPPSLALLIVTAPGKLAPATVLCTMGGTRFQNRSHHSPALKRVSAVLIVLLP